MVSAWAFYIQIQVLPCSVNVKAQGCGFETHRGRIFSLFFFLLKISGVLLTLTCDLENRECQYVIDVLLMGVYDISLWVGWDCLGLCYVFIE